MNQPNKFDPPDLVVAPAFRELYNRLQRAQMSNRKRGEITAEERKAFEYGVAERQKVLGHSLFLVFTQWAIYRQAISRIKSRAIRFTYAMGAVVSTSLFVQRRAAKVSKDTFAHIITTNMDSALGNEARIILAELEGPEGPYFRQVCREREFVTDFSAIPIDDEHHDVHPQLRLKPRLLVEMPPHPQIPALRREGAERGIRSRTDSRDWRVMQPHANDMRGRAERNRVGRSQTFNHRATTPKESDALEEETQNETSLKDLFTGSEELERIEMVERARQRKQSGGNFAPADQDDFWGKPFDFSSAARERESEWDIDFDPYSDMHGVADDDQKPMTPSQRRAAERRLRRLRAQARAQEKVNDE